MNCRQLFHNQEWERVARNVPGTTAKPFESQEKSAQSLRPPVFGLVCLRRLCAVMCSIPRPLNPGPIAESWKLIASMQWDPKQVPPKRRAREGVRLGIWSGRQISLGNRLDPGKFRLAGAIYPGCRQIQKPEAVRGPNDV